METKDQKISEKISNSITIGDGSPLLLIAGPCQIESKDHALFMAKSIQNAIEGLPVNLVYKSSYDKANRTSASGKRGIGIEEGLKILQDVKNEFNVPVITDVHLPSDVSMVAEVVDILQIPAFLCRQTDLLLAAGSANKTVMIKKGQFLAPSDMKFAAEKVRINSDSPILLCERGTSFGYRDLVVDFRGLGIMRSLGYPVVFDATHSVQSLGGNNGSSGGAREWIRPLSRAAVAFGIDGIFLECHQDPDNAPSDGPSMLRVEELKSVLEELCKIRRSL